MPSHFKMKFHEKRPIGFLTSVPPSVHKTFECSGQVPQLGHTSGLAALWFSDFLSSDPSSWSSMSFGSQLFAFPPINHAFSQHAEMFLTKYPLFQSPPCFQTGGLHSPIYKIFRRSFNF